MPPFWERHCTWQSSGLTCGELTDVLRLCGHCHLCRKLAHNVLHLCDDAHIPASRLVFSWSASHLAQRDCTPGCNALQPSLVSTCAPCVKDAMYFLTKTWAKE